MIKDVVTVAPTDDQEIAARLIAHYNFMALPVVEQGRILGVITVDDIIDVLIEEGTEDQLRFGAVEPGVLNQPYFTTPILRVVRSRVGWLVLLFVAETLTGTVLRHFEGEIAKVVALSFFVPLLIGTGGNTGAQTVSTIIRGLALKEIRLRDTLRVLLRELWGGLLLGVSMAVIAFGRSELWGSGYQLSLVVALSIFAIVIWANTIGALIPSGLADTRRGYRAWVEDCRRRRFSVGRVAPHAPKPTLPFNDRFSSSYSSRVNLTRGSLAALSPVGISQKVFDPSSFIS
jgi:magnesium transporter